MPYGYTRVQTTENPDVEDFGLLAPSQGGMPYYDTTTRWTETPSVSYGRSLLNTASASALRTAAGLVIGTDVQAYDPDLTTWAGITPGANWATLLGAARPTTAAGYSIANGAVLDAITASFTTADETKLDGIEALADVTDAVNVAAAGAVMDTDFASNGIMARTASGTYGLRALLVSGAALAIANGDMVAGNATLTIDPGLMTVTTRTALKGLASGKRDATYTYNMLGRSSVMDGGGGLFTWTSDNVAGEVAEDPSEGIYIVPTGQDGSSGAFRRVFEEAYNVKWFGATGNGSTNETAAIDACRDTATLNTGLTANPVGSPTIIFPLGKYVTTGHTIDTYGERWISYGARLDAAGASQFVVRVSAAAVVLEDLVLYSPFVPSTANGLLEHTTGSDCAFRKVVMVGGWNGFKGTGGGDSHFEDCKIYDAFADFVYLQGYAGMWSIRGKYDGRWPVLDPSSANDKGNWATSTVYVAGDVVLNGAWYFQCSTGGTSAGSGGGPSPTTLDTPITDGSAVWKTHRFTSSAGVYIDSECFINEFLNTDVTGGHIHCFRANNSLSGNAPQTIVFTASEAGAGWTSSFLLQAANGVYLNGSLIHNSVQTAGIGVNVGAVEHLQIQNCPFWGHTTAIAIVSTTKAALIQGNTFAGATTCVSVGANTTRFNIQNNMMGGSTTWGNNTDGVVIASGSSDDYQVTGNNFDGLTGTPVSDAGTGIDKTVQTTNGPPATPSSTSAALGAIGNAINTSNKLLGRLIYDSTTENLLLATGAAAGSKWANLSGGSDITPA